MLAIFVTSRLAVLPLIVLKNESLTVSICQERHILILEISSSTPIGKDEKRTKPAGNMLLPPVYISHLLGAWQNKTNLTGLCLVISDQQRSVPMCECAPNVGFVLETPIFFMCVSFSTFILSYCLLMLNFIHNDYIFIVGH